MQVTLISVYESIVASGLRTLSAVLKRAGIQTRMIFLPRETEGFRWEGFRYAFAGSVLGEVATLAKDSDLIGISLMSNYFNNACQVTQHLRRFTRAPIVWGGIHPTIRPEECLKHADIVCVGEGEDALLELAQQMSAGKGVADIGNMWHKRNGEIVRTPVRPLPNDLDRFPYPDYDLDTQFVLFKGEMLPLSENLLLYYLAFPYNSDSAPAYGTIMSRGCLYACTYCCNNALQRIYEKQWRIRRRSVANIVDELTQIKARFPGIEWIRLDDDFFLDDLPMVREFAAAYKQAVHLPLESLGFHPGAVTDEKIGLLVDAGLRRVHMGIQAGSTQALHRVYKRPGSFEQTKRAIQIFHKYTDRMTPPVYELILDNPWESEEEKVQTLRLILDTPQPYMLSLFSLTFYPGTELHERAQAEGILQDDQSQVYGKFYLKEQPTYINGLFRLFQFEFTPHWLMVWLLTDKMRRLNWVWLPYLIRRVLWLIGLTGAGWRAIRRRDWSAFGRAWRARHGNRTIPMATMSIAR